MAYQDLYYALVIPGLGHPDWGVLTGGATRGANWAIDKPIALFDGSHTDVAGADDFVNFSLLSAENPPDHLGGSINYRSGTMEVGSLKFEIVSDGPEKPFMPGELPSETVDIGEFFATRRVAAAGLLAADLAFGITSITLWSRGGTGFSSGQTIYIERESIHLQSLTSTDAVNNTQTFVASRGCFGSHQTTHLTDPQAPNPPTVTSGHDNRVWAEKDPRNSECYVVEWNGTSTDIIWRGYFTQEPETSEDGLTLSIEPQDALALLVDRSQNEETYGTEEKSLLVGIANRAMHFSGGSNLKGKSRDWGSIRTQPFVNAAPVCLQFGDSLYAAYWEITEQRYIKYRPIQYNGGVVDGNWGEFHQGTVGGSPEIELDFNETEETTGIEVLAVGAGVNTQARNADLVVTSQNISYVAESTTDTNPYIHHPLYILLCYLLSTGRFEFQGAHDIWNVGVGAAIPLDMVDVTGIEALMALRPQEQIHFSVIGWGGSSYSFRDVINKWLLPFKYYMHVTPGYKLTVSRLQVLRVADTTQVLSSDIVLVSEEQSMGWDEVVGTLSASASLPWEDDRTIEIRDLSQGLLQYDPRPVDPEFNLDVSCLRPSSAVDGGRQRAALDGALQFYRRPIPSYTFQIHTSLRIHAGMKLRLLIDEDESIFYKASGERMVLGDSVLGIVTEVRTDFLDGTTEVVLSGVNDPLVSPPKSIAPSFKVTGVSGLVVSFSYNEFGPIAQEAWIKHIQDAGFSVEFWDPTTGKVDVYTGGPEVSIVGLGLLTVGVDVQLTFTAAFDIAPEIGWTMRIVTRDNVPGGGVGANLEFAYMAGPSETFSDGTPGDIFV